MKKKKGGKKNAHKKYILPFVAKQNENKKGRETVLFLVTILYIFNKIVAYRCNMC